MTAPQSNDEMILSFCLSLDCISADNLKKCRAWFKQKQRPPKFSDSVIEQAKKCAREAADDSDSSIVYPPEMLEFADLDDDDDDESPARRKTVRVHVIGRPKGLADDEPPRNFGKEKTFFRETWVIGRDIAEDMVNHNLDGDQLFIWYRWIGNRWSWCPVTRGKFAQLKAVEDGNPF